jgi:hypothetical protein
MGSGGVIGTELMPSLVGGDAERCCGKLKDPKRFLKPNFERGPSRTGLAGKSLDLSGV